MTDVSSQLSASLQARNIINIHQSYAFKAMKHLIRRKLMQEHSADQKTNADESLASSMMHLFTVAREADISIMNLPSAISFHVGVCLLTNWYSAEVISSSATVIRSSDSFL